MRETATEETKTEGRETRLNSSLTSPMSEPVCVYGSVKGRTCLNVSVFSCPFHVFRRGARLPPVDVFLIAASLSKISPDCHFFVQDFQYYVKDEIYGKKAVCMVLRKIHRSC